MHLMKEKFLSKSNVIIIILRENDIFIFFLPCSHVFGLIVCINFM